MTALGMKIEIQTRDSQSAARASRLGGFALVLLCVSGLSHRYGLLETVPFFWVLGIVGLTAALALGLAFAGLIDVWERGDRGAGRSVGGGLMALLVLAPFVISGWRVIEYPRLVDVSTDTARPPEFVALALSRPSDAYPVEPIGPAQARQIAQSYPEIGGRRYTVSPDRVLEAVDAIIAKRGWEVVETRGVPQQDPEISVEAHAFSYLLRFPADFVVRLTDEDTSTFVDVRSASPYARHDLGDNAKRIERFLADLDLSMETRTEAAPEE